MRRCPIPRVTPSLGCKIHGSWEKLAIFDVSRRLSPKRCKIGRWLLWNINRKSWVPDRMVSFSMTSSDCKPRFQGHCILPNQISQNRCILGTKLLKNTNRKPYTSYLMVPLSMTLSDLWPQFQGHDIFQHWISQKWVTQDRAMVTIERRLEVICALLYDDISNYLDGPLTRFSRSQHFWSQISQKWCILVTKLLKNTNRKPHTSCRMVPLSMTLSDLWPDFKVTTFFNIEYLRNDTR